MNLEYLTKLESAYKPQLRWYVKGTQSQLREIPNVRAAIIRAKEEVVLLYITQRTKNIHEQYGSWDEWINAGNK